MVKLVFGEYSGDWRWRYSGFIVGDMSFILPVKTVRLISIGLLLVSAITLIAFQIKPAGWLILGLSVLSLAFTDRKFAKDLLLVNISLGIIGLTPITTDISYGHFAVMGSTLSASVLIPYLVSRFAYKDYRIRFPFHHGRRWYKKEVAYIAFAGVMAYLILPFYLINTGAYHNWPSGTDTSSISRLFIGTNALGIWDELFFIGVVFGLLRNYFSFIWANIFQAVLWASFLFELGFIGWGPVAVFLFALLQGVVFKRTESLLYIVTIHLTVDFFLFLSLIHAHHSHLINIFLT